MANSFESDGSSGSEAHSEEPKSWIKIGLVATATALAGGLVAAWWYRQTLAKLHEAENDSENPHFGIPEDKPADEV